MVFHIRLIYCLHLDKGILSVNHSSTFGRIRFLDAALFYSNLLVSMSFIASIKAGTTSVGRSLWILTIASVITGMILSIKYCFIWRT